MDFRALDLAAVRVSPGRGAAVACDAGGAVRVQTPPCRCFVVPGPGRYTLRLYLDSPLGRDFADFLGRVDALLAPHHDGMQTSSAVWNDSLKLTAFDDAQFFGGRRAGRVLGGQRAMGDAVARDPGQGSHQARARPSGARALALRGRRRRRPGRPRRPRARPLALRGRLKCLWL